MFTIAVFSGVMTTITFGLIISIVIKGSPYSKVDLTFASVGFLLLGGIFIATSLNSQTPCDTGSQRVTVGESTVCVQNHEVVELIESNKLTKDL